MFLCSLLSVQDRKTVKAAIPHTETVIHELAGHTEEKLNKLTEEAFAGLVFLPADKME